MNRRTVAAILAVIFMCAAVPALAEPVSVNVHIRGAIFGGADGDNIPAEAVFDPDWLTKGDNTVPNAALAQIACLMSADSYFRDKDLAKGTEDRVLPEGGEEAYDHTYFLRRLGFTETRYVESFREKEYASDAQHSVTMVLGHLRTAEADVFAVVVRGAFSAGEWQSVFDPGDPEQAAELHPEWACRERSMGLDIAAERAKEFIAEFIASCGDPDLPDCVLYTGHSRGACLADIIGTEAERESTAKTFTYTFNSAPVAFGDDLAAQTVFNYLIAGDFFNDPLPFKEEKSGRYGTDIVIDPVTDPDLSAAIAALRGREASTGVPETFLSAYAAAFGERFPRRAGLTKPVTVTRTFATEEEAAADLAGMQTLLGAEGIPGLGALCALGEVTEAEGKYAYTFTCSDMAILEAYSMELAYGAPVADALVRVFREDTRACEIALLLKDQLAALSAGHRLIIAYAAVTGQKA